jgi:hypothetical protein
LPTGEGIGTINKEAYPEDYHGPREFWSILFLYNYC